MASSVIAAFSAVSAVSFQRSFVAVQSEACVHFADAAGGSHCAGSLSAFDLFVFAVTATRLRAEPRSLACCSRRFASQPEGPAGGERHFNLAVFLGPRAVLGISFGR